MSHPSKDGVDRLMLHIQKAVNLRAEAEKWKHIGWVAPSRDRYKGENSMVKEVRREADDALRDAEYMVYELIDSAMDQFVGRKGRLSKVTAALRSKNQGGNIPTATEREDG